MNPDVEADSVALAAAERTAPSPTQESAALTSATFLSRVSGFPLVSTTIQSAISVYGDSKRRFVVLDSLETSVRQRVLPQVQPIVNQGLLSLHAYDAQLARLDAYACSGLDALETRLPIIREPTEAVIASSKRLVDDSVQSVRTKVARSLEGGKQLLSTNVDTALRLSEAAVDRFFPAPPAASDSLALADDTLLDAAAPLDEKLAVSETPYGRAQRLGHTVHERLASRALAHLYQRTTPEALELVNHTMEQVNAHLQSMRAALAQAQASVVQSSVQATVPLRTASSKFLGSLQSASASVASIIPPKVHADTEHLRQALATRIADLRASSHAIADHAWGKQVHELANASLAYLSTVRLQLVGFYATHAPAALQLVRLSAPTPAALELEELGPHEAPLVEAH